MADKKGRYQIHESSKHYGKFVVIDTQTKKEHPFYNLTSARAFVKDREKTRKNE